MELGGNIVLDGFDNLEYTELIVVKKMVGQSARQVHDARGDFERLSLTLDGQTITGTLRLDGNEYRAEERAENLYFGLDRCLKRLQEQV